MNAAKGWLRKIHWSIIMLWVFTIMVIGAGTMRPFSLLARPPRPESPGQIEPQGSRQFISLPDVSTFSVENLPGATAHITTTFALPDGTLQNPISDTLLPGSMVVYTATQNFSGTASIDFDRPVYAVNFELSDSGNQAYLGSQLLSQFASVSRPSVPIATFDIFLPLVVKAQQQGWSSRFALQNPALAPATFAVVLYDQAGNTYDYFTSPIAPNGSVVIDLASITTSPPLPSDFSGSAVVASDQPIAVSSVRLANDRLGLRTAYRGGDYSNIGQTLIAPVLVKSSNLQTSQLCVQNTDNVSSTVMVTYTDGLTASASINPGAAHCFDQGVEEHASGWSGGAIVSGSALLSAVADVIATDPAKPANANQIGRWSYIVPSQPMLGSTLAMPLVFQNFQSFTSDINLYNSGSASALITPRYVSNDGVVYCPAPFTLPAGGTLSIVQSRLPGTFKVGMAYFTTTQPVAAAVRFTTNKPLGDTDRHFGYDAAYTTDSVTSSNTCAPVHDLFLAIIRR